MSNSVKLLKKFILRASDHASSKNEVEAALNAASKIVDRITNAEFGDDTSTYIEQLEAERDSAQTARLEAIETIGRLEREATAFKIRAERAEKDLKVAEKRNAKLMAQAQQPHDPPGWGGSSGVPETEQNHSGCDSSDFGVQHSMRHSEVSYVPYETLAVRARTIFGRAQWLGALAYHLNVPLKKMSAWRTVGLAPVGFIAELEKMTEIERQPASRSPWTPVEHNVLKSLLNKGKSDLEVAHIISDQFGRPTFESSIAGQRRRLRLDESWVPMRRSRRANHLPFA